MPQPLKVCYFGAYKLTYPRNLFYRDALRRLGVEVIECRVSTRQRTIWRAFNLLRQFWKEAYKADILFVAEFNQTLVPLAWLLAKLHGMAVVFDPGLSFYDWYVLLTKEAAPNSIKGIYWRWVETLAFRLPDVVIWFTPLDLEYFEKLFSIPHSHSAWIPPGIDQSIFFPTPLPGAETPFIVHWDGNMAPMHGLDIVLRAAQLLQNDETIRFEIIGEGSIYAEMRSLATELNLGNVRFFGSVSADELRDSVQRAQLCLGVFRGDDKLRRSLYTKEIQAMMAERPLITGYGEAKARVFKNGTDLVMIPPEAPQALADTIKALQGDRQRRVAISQAGARAAANLCDPDSAGAKLLEILQMARARHSKPLVGQDSAPPL